VEQLCLLTPEPAAPDPPVSGRAHRPTPARPRTVTPVPKAAPAEPGSVWYHPQANRRAVLHGQELAYCLRRGQRRTIGFSVGPQGLCVSAPRWVLVSAIEAALQAKAEWVLRKLAEVRQRGVALQATRVAWADGVVVNWLGGTLTVRLGHPPPDPAASVTPVPLPALVPVPVRSAVSAATPVSALAQAKRSASGLANCVAARRGQPLVQLVASDSAHAWPATLWVALPASADASQLRDAVQAWMMQAAQAHFVLRLDHFAPLLGVRWTQLKLSAANTRWGSAKADGSIRLHWRLMHFAPEVLDYVVAHELAHLRHMDHSDRFWRTVESVVPDYAVLRARLKGERLPPW
jgi:predicted metal-dependent hydrolase